MPAASAAASFCLIESSAMPKRDALDHAREQPIAPSSMPSAMKV